MPAEPPQSESRKEVARLRSKSPGMRPRTPFGLALPLGLILTAALAGCGTSQATNASSGAGSPGSGGQPTVSTPTVTATPPAVTVTSPGTLAGGACVAADLSASYLGGQGATGHGELGFELRNTGPNPCRTYGYPGVQFVDRSGKPLPTATTRTTQDFFGSVPERHVELTPGASASFRLGVTHGAASPAGCTTAYGLSIIPPDDTASLHVAIPGGAYECATATVSPLVAGTAAFP